MALDNSEVLKNLQEQLTQVQQQLEVGRTTALRLQGAIEVLQQIEESKETPETEIVDGGEVEAPPAEGE
jgi:methylthioribose-1-phosphate isomerase|tara:strand:+ start:169 stop:375 length:207 start_codon:yes stop_codon:yes gene_type:complete